MISYNISLTQGKIYANVQISLSLEDAGVINSHTDLSRNTKIMLSKGEIPSSKAQRTYVKKTLSSDSLKGGLEYSLKEIR